MIMTEILGTWPPEKGFKPGQVGSLIYEYDVAKLSFQITIIGQAVITIQPIMMSLRSKVERKAYTKTHSRIFTTLGTMVQIQGVNLSAKQYLIIVVVFAKSTLKSTESFQRVSLVLTMIQVWITAYTLQH